MYPNSPSSCRELNYPFSQNNNRLLFIHCFRQRQIPRGDISARWNRNGNVPLETTAACFAKGTVYTYELRCLKGTGNTSYIFGNNSYKGDNFCDFLSAFPSKKMSTLKGKKGSKLFPFGVNSFFRSKAKQFRQRCLPWSCDSSPVITANYLS